MKTTIQSIKILLLSLPSLVCAISSSVQDDVYNVANLKNDREMEKYAAEKGFKEYYTFTEDGLKLRILFKPALRKSDQFQEVSILFVHGWSANATRMMPQVALLKEFADYCNIAILDLRGAGKSEGPSHYFDPISIFPNVHFDIIAGLEFLNSVSAAPIILYGSCLGSYAIGRALEHTIKSGHVITRYRLRMIILDSPWLNPALTTHRFVYEKIFVFCSWCLPSFLARYMAFGLHKAFGFVLFPRFIIGDHDHFAITPEIFARIKCAKVLITYEFDPLVGNDSIDIIKKNDPLVEICILPGKGHAVGPIKNRAEYQDHIMRAIKQVTLIEERIIDKGDNKDDVGMTQKTKAVVKKQAPHKQQSLT